MGFYRLVMKSGSDNFRSSAIQGILKRLKEEGVRDVVFEPELDASEFHGSKIVPNLKEFKDLRDVIVAN